MPLIDDGAVLVVLRLPSRDRQCVLQDGGRGDRVREPWNLVEDASAARAVAASARYGDRCRLLGDDMEAAETKYADR